MQPTGKQTKNEKVFHKSKFVPVLYTSNIIIQLDKFCLIYIVDIVDFML